MSQISKQAHEALVVIAGANKRVHTVAHAPLSALSNEVLGEVLAALKYVSEDRRVFRSLADKVRDVTGARKGTGVAVLVFEILNFNGLEAHADAAAKEFVPMVA